MATSGTFVFLMAGKPSGDIRTGMTEHQVKAALERSAAITDVSVTYSVDNGTACTTDTVNVVRVEFTQDFGSRPPLVALANDLAGTVEVSADGVTTFQDTQGADFTSVKGTKEDDECANRGACNPRGGRAESVGPGVCRVRRKEGVYVLPSDAARRISKSSSLSQNRRLCPGSHRARRARYDATCLCSDTNGDTFASSDGYNQPGDRGDCGYAATVADECPGMTSCSGNGVCDAETFRCQCQKGFYGADCGLQSCPLGPAWFSYAAAAPKSIVSREILFSVVVSAK